MQFLKFCIVGFSNTVLSYLIYVVVLKLLQPLQVSWDYITANLISFFLSVLWSFYWNSRFVFNKHSKELKSVILMLLKTYISYAFTGILLTNILSYIWIEMMKMSKYIAPLLNLIVSVPINYILNKNWAFQAKNTDV